MTPANDSPERTGGQVTAGYGAVSAMQRTRAILRQAYETVGSYGKVAEAHPPLNKALVRKVITGEVAWSAAAVRAVLGEEWIQHTVWHPYQTGQPTAAPIICIPPRQCPITGEWFIPVCPQQRYLPGLSQALRRAYRRNPEHARTRYSREGDWGRR